MATERNESPARDRESPILAPDEPIPTTAAETTPPREPTVGQKSSAGALGFLIAILVLLAIGVLAGALTT